MLALGGQGVSQTRTLALTRHQPSANDVRRASESGASTSAADLYRGGDGRPTGAGGTISGAPFQPAWSRPWAPAVSLQEGRSKELCLLHQRFQQAATNPRQTRFGEPPPLQLQRREDAARGGLVVASQQQLRLRAAKLECDIVLVAAEAGMPRNAAASLVTAAIKGKITSNPGTLLSQIMGLLTLEDCLGRRQIQSLIRVMPVLLNHSPQTLRWNFEVLCSILGDDTAGGAVAIQPSTAPVRRRPKSALSSRPVDVRRLITRVPALLIASPHRLWANLDALMRILQADFPTARSLALRQPRLLVNSSAALHGRFTELQSVTGLDVAGVTDLLSRQPGLLTYMPHTLAANLQSLSHQLGVPLARVTPLLIRNPAVLMLAPATVEEKLEALSALLCMPRAALTFLVLQQPSLLTLSTANLEDKVSELGSLLGISYSDATSLAAASPNMLTLSISGLRVKLALLRSLVAGHASWRDQLASATTRTLAHMLCFSAARMQRLEAVAATGQAATYSFSTLLGLKDAQFAQRLAALQAVGKGMGVVVQAESGQHLAAEAAEEELGASGVDTAAAPTIRALAAAGRA